MDDVRIGLRIHINGIVQGVGFRPFVYGLATELALTGWVRNTSAGVDIEIDGPPETLEAFVAALKDQAPPLARIDRLEVEEFTSNGSQEFRIIHSQSLPGAFQPISPDVSICPDCLNELFDPNNRYYRYPFINCTNCGPRFTIIRDIPYDRPATTMAPFEMCPGCEKEYNDPLNRRFHAQPVACPACGPKIWLEIGGKPVSLQEEALQATRALIAEGKVAAIKGLGGFHLACDAANSSTVAELRKRKQRVDKPFALMMPDLETVQRHCRLNSAEAALLTSRERPIVILERKPTSSISDDVAPGQLTLGVMLPYTPLHYLLTEPAPNYPEALVMTSGNFSEEPITSNNEDARQQLSGVADVFLLHDRQIHTRCDDSVVRILHNESPQLYPLRRSRGYVPQPIHLPWDVLPLLATGGELKNTICLTRDRYTFLSQHIGDLENYETLHAFESCIAHFEKLFRIKPEILAHDLHPDYLSTRFALNRAENDGLPTIGIQHHHAHIAACMAEHGLAEDQTVIGIAFDGTGYGEDGAIWGGEFLVAGYQEYERPYHLAYIPLPGGEKAIKEPCRVALAWLHCAEVEWQEDLFPVQAISSPERRVLRQQLESGLNAPPTSSMGRLFDAVAALAGVRQRVNYEAQAAIELESLVDPSETRQYDFDIRGNVIDPTPMIKAVLKDMHSGISSGVIAARFHNGVAEIVRQTCIQLRRQCGLDCVVLSGGVWQNMTLLNKTISGLSKDGFNLLLHSKVPANDGGISLGQAAIAALKSQR